MFQTRGAYTHLWEFSLAWLRVLCTIHAYPHTPAHPVTHRRVHARESMRNLRLRSRGNDYVIPSQSSLCVIVTTDTKALPFVYNGLGMLRLRRGEGNNNTLRTKHLTSL